MKIVPLKVTDEQDEAIKHIAAAHGLSVADLQRMALELVGQQVNITFPQNVPAWGHGLKKSTQTTAKAKKGRKGS